MLLAVCAKAHCVSKRNKDPTSSYPMYSFQLKHCVVKWSNCPPLSLPTVINILICKLTFQLQSPNYYIGHRNGVVVCEEQIFEMQLLYAGKRIRTHLCTPTVPHLTLNFLLRVFGY